MNSSKELRVKHTVYLPDDLGQWAKDQNLNLSAMLRHAVLRVQRHQAAVAEAESRPDVFMLPVDTAEGRTYTVRLHGKLVAHTDDYALYLTGTDQFFLHVTADGNELRELDRITDLDPKAFDLDFYVTAADAMQEDVVIDVGLS